MSPQFIGQYSCVKQKNNIGRYPPEPNLQRKKTMKAYVLITIRTGEISQVVRQLNSLPGVTEAHMTLGPYDSVAVIEGSDVNEIGNILASTIQPVPGVLETLTCLLIDQ